MPGSLMLDPCGACPRLRDMEHSACSTCFYEQLLTPPGPSWRKPQRKEPGPVRKAIEPLPEDELPF